LFKPSTALVLALLFVLSSKFLAAQPAAAPNSAEKLPTLKYEKYKLPNGLDVILSEDHRLPLVAVNLWYHVGPANERPGRTGFAHLFEHMMFEGSKHIGSKAHFRYLEGAGASDINGTTDFDRTNYFETLPSNQLELALWLESDRMGYLLDTLDREKLENQRDVVRNERRQSVENQPYGLVEEEIFHQLYPKGHPYYASVIGSHADIEAARIADIRQFFAQYYVPNNASLAIVGDFDPAQAKAMVEKYFGSIPAGPPVPKIDAPSAPITSERRVTVTDQVELPRVYMAWLTPSIYSAGDADADLAAHILGGGKSSRLYKKLVYERQIAQDVEAQNYSLTLGSPFFIQATAKPGVKPEDLEKVIDEELAAFRKDGPTQAELERARNAIESDIIRRLETLGGFGGVADRLNRYNHYLGNPDYLSQDLRRYNDATVATVRSLAEQKLANNERVVIYGIPGTKHIEDVPKTKAEGDGKEAEVAVTHRMPDQDWRKNAPKPAVLSSLSLPAPLSFKLNNGLTLLLSERHNLPIISANLIVLGGNGANPADKPGLASFTTSMLQEGTKNRSALKIADDADQIGATISTEANYDYSAVTIRTLSKNVKAGLDLLSDMTLHPTFGPKDVDRIRNQRLTEILQENDNVNRLALKASYRVLYGDKHPYGFMNTGTESSTKNTNREDVVKFWQTAFVPENSALILVGDLTSTQARELAEKCFGGWTGSHSKLAPPEVDNKVTRSVVIVDKPGAPQTALRLVSLGADRSTPDYVPMQVMNTAFGGLFSSRINMNLREKHGYTYGAFSTFDYRRAIGPFAARSGIRTDATAPAVKELLSEVDRIRTTPLAPEELLMAKGAYALSLAGRFETTPQTAMVMGDLFAYGLPLDYYRTLPAKIDAVSAAEVQAMATKYLVPENMVIVAAGDKAKIQPELQKLNIGPLQQLDYAANPVKAQAAAASQ
jgi:zinc protease